MDSEVEVPEIREFVVPCAGNNGGPVVIWVLIERDETGEVVNVVVDKWEV